jgi:hypothetical protein
MCNNGNEREFVYEGMSRIYGGGRKCYILMGN